jgi:hypothetical protein
VVSCSPPGVERQEPPPDFPRSSDTLTHAARLVSIIIEQRNQRSNEPHGGIVHMEGFVLFSRAFVISSILTTSLLHAPGRA